MLVEFRYLGFIRQVLHLLIARHSISDVHIWDKRRSYRKTSCNNCSKVFYDGPDRAMLLVMIPVFLWRLLTGNGPHGKLCGCKKWLWYTPIGCEVLSLGKLDD